MTFLTIKQKKRGSVSPSFKLPVSQRTFILECREHLCLTTLTSLNKHCLLKIVCHLNCRARELINNPLAQVAPQNSCARRGKLAPNLGRHRNTHSAIGSIILTDKEHDISPQKIFSAFKEPWLTLLHACKQLLCKYTVFFFQLAVVSWEFL